MYRDQTMARQIPRDRVEEGLSLCRRQISDLVDTARIILRGDTAGLYLRFVYLLLQYAIEEFGKALMLKEEFLRNSSETLRFDKWVSHEYKFNKAWDVLDKGLKVVHEGAFDTSAFDPAIFDTNVEASHRLRLEAGYVDYVERKGEWTRITHIQKWDRDRFLLLADDLERKMRKHLYL